MYLISNVEMVSLLCFTVTNIADIHIARLPTGSLSLQENVNALH